MVTFTLKDGMGSRSIMMEMPAEETMSELNETVREYWGKEGMMFVKDYRLLDLGSRFGEYVSDGDVIEVFPDLRIPGKV
jgi:hypothetical protein